MMGWTALSDGWWRTERGECCRRIFHCWPALLEEFSTLPQVVVSTGNPAVRATILQHHPSWVPAEPIAHLLDASGRMEFRLAAWAYGLAVEEPGTDLRHSFQFFDATDSGILKLLFTPGTEAAFHRAARDYAWDGPPSYGSCAQVARTPASAALPSSHASHLWPRLHRWALRDVLASEPMVRRIEVLAACPDWARPLPAVAWEELAHWWMFQGASLEIQAYHPGLTLTYRIDAPRARQTEKGWRFWSSEACLDFDSDEVATLWVVAPARPGDSCSLEAFTQDGVPAWSLRAPSTEPAAAAGWNLCLQELAQGRSIC